MITINLAVVGCRQFDDYATFEEKLLKYIAELEQNGIEIKQLLTIADPGVNAMVEDFCTKHNRVLKLIECDWDLVGKSAHFQSNGDLINRSTHVVCFWDRVDPYVGDVVEKGLKARKYLKILRVAVTDKKYYSVRQKANFQKVKANEQTSVCKTVSE